MEHFFADYWLRIFDTTASTQDDAKTYHQHAGGDNKKVVFLSGRQTAGYGRHGRAFLDDGGADKNRGDNFFLSLYLPRVDVVAGQLASISLVVGISLFDAVAEFLPSKDGLRLKWPNDMLWQGKKLAGILVEKIDGALIIGVGVNLHHAPDGFACLAQAGGKEVPAITLLAKVFLEQLDKHLPTWQAAGFAPFLPLYQPRAIALGSVIEFTVPKESQKKTGIYQGITPDGTLQVMVNGVLEKFSVAEIL